MLFSLSSTPAQNTEVKIKKGDKTGKRLDNERKNYEKKE